MPTPRSPIAPPPLPPRRLGAVSEVWILGPALVASAVTGLLLLAWAAFFLVGMGFLLYTSAAPRGWTTAVLRWYPVLAFAGTGAGTLSAVRLLRRGARSRLAGLGPGMAAALPAALLLVAVFRSEHPHPLEMFEFATRAERRLAVAANTGDLAALEQALREGGSPDTASADGTPVLVMSVMGRQHAAFLRLLEAGAAPGGRGDEHGLDAVTAIALDARELAPPASRWLEPLLDHGLPVGWDAAGPSGSLLQRFAEADDADSVRLLLERGADPAARGGQARLTPFHAAVKEGRFRAALALLPRVPLEELEPAEWNLASAPGHDGEAGRALEAALLQRLGRGTSRP